MQQILEKLFEAADHHAEDTGEDHTVGDLQDLLSRAWAIMSVEQRIQLLESNEVEALVEAGAREEFSVGDLLTAATTTLEITAQGYRIKESDTFPTAEIAFHWELGEEHSENFSSREAAIEDAHRHLVATAKPKK